MEPFGRGRTIRTIRAAPCWIRTAMAPVTRNVLVSTMAGRSRGHELLRGALLGTYLFLLVTGSVIAKAARDALFLSYFTALQMTYADLQTLVAIGVAMAVYFRVRRSLT